MANNILGMLVGAGIDRDDGGSGVEGALIGYVGEGLLKVVLPLAITFAIGWGAQYLARRALDSLEGGAPIRR